MDFPSDTSSLNNSTYGSQTTYYIRLNPIKIFPSTMTLQPLVPNPPEPDEQLCTGKYALGNLQCLLHCRTLSDPMLVPSEGMVQAQVQVQVRVRVRVQAQEQEQERVQAQAQEQERERE